jgi:hypothetical protein
VLNFIAYYNSGFTGWQNTGKLSLNSRLEDHHIFPRGFIDSKYAQDEKAQSFRDCVVNRTLIPKLLNIRIGKRQPSEYLSEISKSNPSLGGCLTDHFIPTQTIEGLFDDFFTDFIEERAAMIFDALQKSVFSQRQAIEKQYFQEPARAKESSIKIFRTYLGVYGEAIFNTETQKVKYNGNELTVSGAAEEFKRSVKSTDTMTANGWRFWKYIDQETQQERPIDDFREV